MPCVMLDMEKTRIVSSPGFCGMVPTSDTHLKQAGKKKTPTKQKQTNNL